MSGLKQGHELHSMLIFYTLPVQPATIYTKMMNFILFQEDNGGKQ